jgi:hypothetical protein
MFKLKRAVRAIQFLAAGLVISVSASAQSFLVANSTGGSQVAASPISQVVANLQSNINNAQYTANVANNQANYAAAVGNNAQNSANYAQGLANSAQYTANVVAGRVDATWDLGIRDCALSLGGLQAMAYCQMVNPRPW